MQWGHKLKLLNKLSTRVKKIGVLFMDNTWTGSRCQKNKSGFIDMLMGVKADLFGIKADLFFLGKILGKPFYVGALRPKAQPPCVCQFFIPDHLSTIKLIMSWHSKLIIPLSTLKSNNGLKPPLPTISWALMSVMTNKLRKHIIA